MNLDWFREQNDFTRLVYCRGGPNVVKDMCRVSRRTVQSWMEKGCIPEGTTRDAVRGRGIDPDTLIPDDEPGLFL